MFGQVSNTSQVTDIREAHLILLLLLSLFVAEAAVKFMLFIHLGLKFSHIVNEFKDGNMNKFFGIWTISFSHLVIMTLLVLFVSWKIICRSFTETDIIWFLGTIAAQAGVLCLSRPPEDWRSGGGLARHRDYSLCGCVCVWGLHWPGQVRNVKYLGWGDVDFFSQSYHVGRVQPLIV